jgi:4a-hydroxytetrahydrobiopterin dehydratase
MEDLTLKVCIACEGDIAPLSRPEAEKLLEQIPAWKISDDGTTITREYSFKDFKEALACTNRIGEIAEQEGHHPDITLGWGRVGVSLTTHAISGLSENDFIVASKVEALFG